MDLLMQYLIICPLVMLAGFIDAIAGGGGLISLPAYMIAGIPVHHAIATNKMSSTMGSEACFAVPSYSSGMKVRSKSEEIIANILFTNHIPFRYEAPLTLNGSTMYPDFTIKNPKNNSYTYWEHLGLMDKKEYNDHAMEKIST